MLQTPSSMAEWILVNEDRIYRYWVYKKIFTPYEQREAFGNESCFEDEHASFGKIEEAVPLGNGDYLIGLRIFEYGPTDHVEYYRLSEIRFDYIDSDQDWYEQDE